MKIAPSKGRLEFVDGTPVNQYLFNTKRRLIISTGCKHLKLFEGLGLLGTSLGRITLIGISFSDTSFATIGQILKIDSMK